jgi:glyoxylase-like metal-dependent hydrolase (beta-lactamase superfamily II)
MILKTLPLGAFATNCFLVYMPESKELFIIDPAAEAEMIVAEAKKFNFAAARILLTHAHIDHISAAGAVAKALNIPQVELAPADWDMYKSPENAIPPYFEAAADLPEVADFAPITNCRVIALPGHTRGGSGFLFEDAEKKFLIAGDTIFAGSIGRTDLYDGDYATLIKSIRENILTLPDDLTIYPGHGGATHVAFEKKHNPYLAE